MKLAVCVFGFNRPDKLKECLDSLASQICEDSISHHIFIDGPRNPAEIAVVLETREVAEIFRRNSHQMTFVHPQPINLGLANHVKISLSQIFEDYDAVIVIEDDLVLSPKFISEMKFQLEIFAKEAKVFSISGHTTPKVKKGEQATEVSNYFSSWGWGTWADRWAAIDWGSEVCGYLELAKFEVYGVRRNKKMLKLSNEKLIDSWAIHVFLYCIKNKLVHIRPLYPLVHNNGLDGTGTHGDSSQIYSSGTFGGEFQKLKGVQVGVRSTLRDLVFYLTNSSPYTFVTSIARLVFFLPALITEIWSSSVARNSDSNKKR